jgi:hypothetical protein
VIVRPHAVAHLKKSRIAGSGSVLPADIALVAPTMTTEQLNKLDMLAAVMPLAESHVHLEECLIAESFWCGVWCKGGNIFTK